VTPSFVKNNLPNGMRAESKYASKFSNGHTALMITSYLTYLIVVQLGISMLFSPQKPCAALPDHVVRVVTICASEEMIRVDAPPVVALVADAISWRNWSQMQHVANAMRVPILAVIQKSSVPLVVGSANPEPACVRFPDVLEESHHHVHAWNGSRVINT
jgi:hypothetical protein